MKAITMMRSVRMHAGILLAACLAGSATAADSAAKVDRASASTTGATGGGRIVIEAEATQPPAPLFFSATADHVIRPGPVAVDGEIRLTLRIVQGRPEVLSLGLSGDGEIVSVTGTGLRDWAVRRASADVVSRGAATSEVRFLDLRPRLTAGAPEPRTLDLVVQTRLRQPAVPGTTALLLVTPGDAVGFASNIRLEPDSSVDVRIMSVTGLVPVGESVEGAHDTQRFTSTTDARLEVRLTPRGTAVSVAQLSGAQLIGRVNEAAGSVEFRLRGQLRVQKAGARVRVLAGRAALSDRTAGDGWHVELVETDDGFTYDLVGDREGTLAVDLGFTAAIAEDGDWRRVGFEMPAGAVVPLRLEGLPDTVEFDASGEVVPVETAQGWSGFLPASGAAAVAWKHGRKAAEGALAFTSSEQTEVRIGAGLLRQEAQIAFRIMQGKLPGVRLRLDGSGEILGVMGSNVLGWSVLPGEEAGARMLEVRLSRPFEVEGLLVVRSQAALDTFPVRAEPLRLTPDGAVRHSGFVRVANNGAVRLEVADVSGMMQLAPAQFPGAALAGDARQVFVYRFPSANYGYRVVANQIQPEIGVSQIVTYELTETDRVINADLELDVREAPLRDWSLLIPEGYAVVTIGGRGVVDHTLESEPSDGYRALKVLFDRPVEGRQLLQLRLERNQPAAADEWRLPPLRFPGAKTVRGHLGAVSAPGYRMVPLATGRLAEVPLSFFPRQTAGLQQAWRLREPEWTAAVRLEALGQSVQADVFHLYSLKEGVVYGSVLFNYFVVGAPAGEWRIAVPESVGNIEIVGQNVRRDWRREGGEVVVTLHQPVLGAATLLVTFEQPMSARGGTIRPGEVRPLGVQGERGFVQVVSPFQVKHTIARAEGGLLKLEPLELPAEYRLLTSSPSLAVFHYTARPFALEMGVEWLPQVETVDQVVDYAILSSQVSREGQVVTDARFFVKTRGRKALRMTLPPDTRLWEARVDREIVTARSDGEHTVVPLPARTNPNEPVEVTLRLGQAAAGSASAVRLVAPRLTVPVVIDEWTVHGDPERLLVPRDGNAALVRAPLTETGFEWITARAPKTVPVLLALIALGALLIRASGGAKLASGIATCAIAAAMAAFLAVQALFDQRPNVAELSYATTMLPAGETLAIELGNVPAWRAMISGWGLGAGLLGLAALLVARWRGSRAIAAGGVVLLATGVLAQRLGAPGFLAAVSGAVFLLMIVPAALRFVRDWRARRDTTPPAGAGAATVASLVLLLGGVALGAGGSPARGAETIWTDAGAKPAQSITQSWTIRDGRLQAEFEIAVRGVVGEAFVLLNPPAVLTEFKGEGVRISKVEGDESMHYSVVLERDGVGTARGRFELPVSDFPRSLIVPTGPAALQRIAVDLDQPGWEFTSPGAVQVVAAEDLAENHSGATLTLAPGAAARIEWQPRRRDVTAEVTQFFVEAAVLYLPGPGVVNGHTRVTVRPAQGRVAELELDVPAGFTVGEVGGGPVGSWRFDPAQRRLRVAVEPAQTSAFSFTVEMQRGTGALPQELTLEPLRVLGAAGEVGMLALGFGGDAQPEGVRVTQLSPINLEDFDAGSMPRDREGRPLAVVQHVWRFGREGGRVELKAAPVAAEVRVASRQLFSFDDDRLVAAVDLDVAILRVGLFKLSFALPVGLEIEALSGAALSHWAESMEDGRRIVTLHLNGRTIGAQRFNLTLAGAAPAAQDAWDVPRVQLREATRQTGELLLVPGKGIRLRSVDRHNAAQLDPRSAGGTQPGTLAFRLLQTDWTLRIGIEALEPWITARALQEVTVREGQTLARIAVRYRIENAAVKQLRLRLPGLSEDQVRTVRATGAAVSDFLKVDGETDGWEVHFQRGIAGETDVQIEFQGITPPEQERTAIATPEFVGARQTTLFVAVRSGGRLELEAAELPRSWQRVDWSAVPGELQSASDRSVPGLCFRVAEPESALAVAVRRHDLAQALNLRVTGGEFTTLFSPEGDALTAVDLRFEVVEKSTLRVKLPAGARLFNTFVNAESVLVVREGGACLFHVSPNSAGDRSATVRMVYSVGAAERGRIALTGPSFSVPLEDVAWHVVIPPGYELEDYAGSLRLRGHRVAGGFGVEQYQALVSSVHSAEARKAAELFDQATALVQVGEQQQAADVLSRAAKNSALDRATNEDARVQLRELKTQQAVLGLNTRRQRLYLDNRGDGARNEQLEQAVNLNPLMQGRTNFDPDTMEQLLMGNTLEENTALRGIASRLVEQQLASEPAPAAIDVTLPQRGRVLTFTRSLQVDGAAPLELTLEIEPAQRTSAAFTLALLAGFAAVATIVIPRKRAR